jgi:hypothetical protein
VNVPLSAPDGVAAAEPGVPGVGRELDEAHAETMPLSATKETKMYMRLRTTTALLASETISGDQEMPNRPSPKRKCNDARNPSLPAYVPNVVLLARKQLIGCDAAHRTTAHARRGAHNGDRDAMGPPMVS